MIFTFLQSPSSPSSSSQPLKKNPFFPSKTFTSSRLVAAAADSSVFQSAEAASAAGELSNSPARCCKPSGGCKKTYQRAAERHADAARLAHLEKGGVGPSRTAAAGVRSPLVVPVLPFCCLGLSFFVVCFFFFNFAGKCQSARCSANFAFIDCRYGRNRDDVCAAR